MWVGTRGGGVSCYDGERFHTFTTAEGLVSDGVSCILEDREGHLWFGSRSQSQPGSGCLSRYDGKDFCTFTTAEGLAGTQVLTIFEDSRGDLWVGTNTGVSRWNGEYFTPIEALSAMSVNAIAEDDQGNLWFAVLSDGI